MTDDQIDVNLPAGEEASISEPSTEEPKATEEVETPEPEATAEGTEETQTETVDTPKKNAQSRIRELNSEKKAAQEEARSLKERLAELTGSVEPQGQPAPFEPQVTEGGEISPEQYKQDVLRTANATVDLKIKQYEAVNRINSEAEQAIRKYPQLDPESELFDEELSKTVTESVIDLVKASPYTFSPKKFVDSYMKPLQRAVTKEVGRVSENIVKQVSQSATRPTSLPTKGEKSDNELSIQELEKKYGVINV